MNFKEYKKKALQNKAFRKEYEKYDLAFEIGQMVLEARIVKGLTQEELAQLVGTKQPSIARLENGQQLSSLSFLEKIADALGTDLLAPKFAFLKSDETPINIPINIIIVESEEVPPNSAMVEEVDNLTATDNYQQNVILT